MREVFLSRSMAFTSLPESNISIPGSQFVAEASAQALSIFPLPAPNWSASAIGTEPSTGDSLGPLVGTMLEKMAIPSLRIYGTLDEPVHAVNLRAKLAGAAAEFDKPADHRRRRLPGAAEQSDGSIQVGEWDRSNRVRV